MSRKEEYQELKNEGWSVTAIASKYGVSRQAVYYALNYQKSQNYH